MVANCIFTVPAYLANEPAINEAPERVSTRHPTALIWRGLSRVSAAIIMDNLACPGQAAENGDGLVVRWRDHRKAVELEWFSGELRGVISGPCGLGAELACWGEDGPLDVRLCEAEMTVLR